MRRTPNFASDVARRAEQKRPLPTSFDSVELPRRDQKDALRGVIRVRGLKPQSAQGAPDEIEVCVHECAKARGIDRERFVLAERGSVQVVDGWVHRSNHP